ncbi:MAG: aspartate kinase [Clostridiaceae bacterium]|nr:aspartate kinase [Clostridiaceae bacterium]
MKVCKFGGSSLAGGEQIRRSGSIVLRDPDRRIMVVSAPGKRSKNDIKVTDLLISLANARISGYDGVTERSAVIGRFADICNELSLPDRVILEIATDIDRRLSAKYDNDMEMLDTLKAAGEDNCAKLVAAWFLAGGYEAAYVNPGEAGLFLSSDYGRARVLPESYANLQKLRERNGILVFPGFFGYTKSGKVATFSRGGSDITGAILAAAVGAHEYENWTDVDSVFAVNPNLVPNPQPLSEISFKEMRELAYAGFSVLHDEALEPAWQHNIPVHILNTNNPDSPGTRIIERRQTFNGVVTGVAGSKGFAMLHITKYLMNREIGFAAKLMQIFADLNLSIEHMPTGIDSITVVVRSDALDDDKLEIIMRRLFDELGVHEAYLERGMAIVMIVGAAMAQTVGVTARATSALSRAGINLELIIQGASEISVLFGVKEEFCDFAIKTLYREFFTYP